MQKELLLEIGSEEIPAGFIGPALKNMQKTMAEKLAGLELQYESIRTAATPRRLAICVNGLISQQPDREEEFLGPAKKAAFDQDNKPTKAAIGFARSKGAEILPSVCLLRNPCDGGREAPPLPDRFIGCWHSMEVKLLIFRLVI